MPAVSRILDDAVRRELRLRLRIGDELRHARLAAGVSQRDVGAALGCSAATISRVERGLIRNVTLVHLTRHASMLGLALRADALPSGCRSGTLASCV